MNNFDQLKYEAGLLADGCWFNLDNYDQLAIEKYGKLIVERCINLCINDGMNRDDYSGRLNAMMDISKHFGVPTNDSEN